MGAAKEERDPEIEELVQHLPLLRALKQLIKSGVVDDAPKPSLAKAVPTEEHFAALRARRRRSGRGT